MLSGTLVNPDYELALSNISKKAGLVDSLRNIDSSVCVVHVLCGLCASSDVNRGRGVLSTKNQPHRQNS
ncbi:hypothetical protein PENSUB_4588 [Penicillium subrubescens]|uniref:Uncharacterized protein n=1 Tax=Penicillium subrubescens TaxID=1316194 RepID=A0A1Q5UBY5_9EURO|nr:hypothetical protein PENSUB_4588 [Penicillium subrubescens]